MKKLTAFVLAFAAALSLCGCEDDESEGSSKKRSSAPSYELNDDDDLNFTTTEPETAAPVTEPLTSEPFTEPTTSSSNKGKYTDLINNGSFTLDGVDYKLPMKYTDLADNGWILDTFDLTETDKLEKDKLTFGHMLKGEDSISVMIDNPNEAPTAVKDCYITCLSVYRSQVEDPEIIKIGDISVIDMDAEEMREAFGPPDYESEDGFGFYSYHSADNGHTVYFSIWNDEKNSVEFSDYTGIYE